MTDGDGLAAGRRHASCRRQDRGRGNSVATSEEFVRFSFVYSSDREEEDDCCLTGNDSLIVYLLSSSVVTLSFSRFVKTSKPVPSM